MKKPARKKAINDLPFVFLFLLTLIVLYGCDTFEEDSIEDATRLEGTKTMLILPNTSAVIDFTTLVNVQNKVSAKIDRDPELGELNKLGVNLYRYTPFDNVKSGTELIPFSIYDQSQNYILSDTLSVIISDGVDSCFHSAVQDIFYIKNDTTTDLHILNNDFICDSLKVDISILQYPLHGTVQVKTNYVTYTSNDYSGGDEFVYRITDTSDTTITSDALVILSISDSTCQLVVESDYFNYNRDVPEQYFDVLFNDHICSDQPVLSVIEGPDNGTANFDNNNLLQYIPSVTDSSYLDSLTYKVCEGGNCGQNKVLFNVFKGSCDFVDAFDDMINIPDSVAIDTVFIDVAANDNFCSSIDITLLEGPSYGTAYVENNGIFYNPDKAVVKNDEILYEMCTENNTACDTAKVSIIREN